MFAQALGKDSTKNYESSIHYLRGKIWLKEIFIMFLTEV